MSYDCHCDYDPPEFWSKQDVKAARKEYRCEECGHKIRVGEPYERVNGKWEGYLDTFLTCQHCVSLREWAKISVPCFCWAHSNLLEDIREMVSEVRHDVPGFFFEYGRRVIAIKRARASQ